MKFEKPLSSSLYKPYEFGGGPINCGPEKSKAFLKRKR